MEKLIKFKEFIKDFIIRRDCFNALIFSSGFFIGSKCTEIYGSIFMAAFWIIASFITRKILLGFNSKINK
jgi:hypothetical protein